MDFKILFENKWVIAVFKNSGVLSVPAREKQDPRAVLGLEIQKKLQTPIFPIHRLDFEVSGVILYAKKNESHQVLNDLFESKKVFKTYQAITSGPQFSHFPKESLMDRSCENLETGRKVFWQAQLHKGKKRVFESPHGKKAETFAIKCEDVGKKQKWELFPVTGRSHQLRWELSRHGFPIIGDSLYGSKIDFGKDKIALQSIEVNFENAKKEIEKFDMPLKFKVPDELTLFKELSL